jgi:hypothetical protein
MAAKRGRRSAVGGRRSLVRETDGRIDRRTQSRAHWEGRGDPRVRDRAPRDWCSLGQARSV